jgi:ABC-type transport system involved in multi-copper enzyme maturation permease subunit
MNRLAANKVGRFAKVISGCGPMLGMELRIVSRQRRTYALRACYVAFMTIAVAMAWVQAIGQLDGVSHLDTGMVLPLLADRIAHRIMWLLLFGGQAWGIIIMADAFERELRGRSLSSLLTTPLSIGQIVLGRFIGRMGQVVLLLLAALPALALMRGFGGIPWNFILAASAVTVSAACSAGAVGMYNSARQLQGWDATRKSILTAAIYSIPAAVWLGNSGTKGWLGLWWVPVGASALAVVYRLARAVGALRYHARHKLDLTPDPDLPPRVARDAYVHLPPVPDEPKGMLVPPPSYAELADDDFVHSVPIEGSPIVWRAKGRNKMQWTRGDVAYLLLLVAGLPLTLALGGSAGLLAGSWVMVNVGLGAMCIAAALMSASAISSERESGCLTLLLTSPMTDGQILGAKVMGIAWRILVVICLVTGYMGTLSMFGLMHIVGTISIVLLGGATLAFVTGLGFYISSLCRRSATAKTLTVGSLVLLWVLGPWLAASVLGASPDGSSSRSIWQVGAGWLMPFSQVGQVARVAVANAPLAGKSVAGRYGPLAAPVLNATIMAVLYASGGLLLAWRAMRRMRRNPT